MLRSANIADWLNGLDLEYRAIGAGRAGCPPNGHFVPEMFGEALGRESLRLQVRYHRSGLFLDENVVTVLLIDTPC